MPSKRSSKLRWAQSGSSHRNRRTHTDRVMTTVRTTSMTSRPPQPLVVPDGRAQLGHRATGCLPATWTTGRRPGSSMVVNTFMSLRCKRKAIRSATGLAPFFSSDKPKSGGQALLVRGSSGRQVQQLPTLIREDPSFVPSVTVLRLMPDTLATSVVPPRPSIRAVVPANNRRWRSSSQRRHHREEPLEVLLAHLHTEKLPRPGHSPRGYLMYDR